MLPKISQKNFLGCVQKKEEKLKTGMCGGGGFACAASVTPVGAAGLGRGGMYRGRGKWGSENKRCCTCRSRDLDRRVRRRRPPPQPQPPPPSASLLYERAVGQTKPRRRRQRNELGLDTAPACLCCLTGHHRIPLRDKSVCFYLLFPPLPSPSSSLGPLP